jgi:hypothetical protein
MLTKNPEERASIQDVLTHDWITANGIQPIPIKHYPAIKIETQDKQSAIGRV